MKITKTQIKKGSKEVAAIMRDLRKRFFELEILQSVWDAQTGKTTKYTSVNALMTDIAKGC